MIVEAPGVENVRQPRHFWGLHRLPHAHHKLREVWLVRVGAGSVCLGSRWAAVPLRCRARTTTPIAPSPTPRGRAHPSDVRRPYFGPRATNSISWSFRRRPSNASRTWFVNRTVMKPAVSVGKSGTALSCITSATRRWPRRPQRRPSSRITFCLARRQLAASVGEPSEVVGGGEDHCRAAARDLIFQRSRHQLRAGDSLRFGGRPVQARRSESTARESGGRLSRRARLGTSPVFSRSAIDPGKRGRGQAFQAEGRGASHRPN